MKGRFRLAVLGATVAMLAACRDEGVPTSVAIASTAVPRTPITHRLVRADVTPNTAQNPSEGNDKEDSTNPANLTVTDTQKIFDALPRVGSLAPDFSLRALDGTTVTLSALRGHAVLINFWASWCIACRAEAPELEASFKQFGSKGLIILGIDDFSNDKLADVQAYVSQYKLTFPILLDEKGNVFDTYRIPGLPTSFFVDANGVIRQLIMVQMAQRDVQKNIELLKTW